MHCCTSNTSPASSNWSPKTGMTNYHNGPQRTVTSISTWTVITAPRASTEDQTCILQTGWLIDGLILSFPQYLTSLRLVLKEPATTWLVGSGYFPPPILGDQVELTCAAARCYIHSIPNGSLPSHYRKQRMANMLVVIPLCY